MTALYSENDPYAAAWLGNLVAEGHIAPGRVDTRSIVDLRPADLDGFAQFHAFAGLGGWSLALRLAGVPDDFPIWTGSCPCQPWSKAGHGRGSADPRHLWPAWFRLIRECRPAIVVGEQVPVAIARGWLDLVAGDLEAADYAFGAVRTRASDHGAPIERQRVWFVAQPVGARVAGQFECGAPRTTGPWEWRGEADLRAIADAPFVAGDRWPAPLVRRVDHGFPGTVGGMSAYGNAIVPQVAAEFLIAALGLPNPPPPDDTARAGSLDYRRS